MLKLLSHTEAPASMNNSCAEGTGKNRWAFCTLFIVERMGRGTRAENRGKTQMADQYAKIVSDNIEKIFSTARDHLQKTLPAQKGENGYIFTAFGQECRIAPDGIFLDGQPETGVLGILISLYALHAKTEPMIAQPFKAFREFPDTAPYTAAFATHTEGILVPHVERIREAREKIAADLSGGNAPAGVGGDFAFTARPLPKIELCYIFYLADEDFPPSVTCLYSNNANLFAPNDALADVGEYSSKRMIKIVESVA